MLSHEAIWNAIDALAARHQLTASGLARRAGLDPTSFNKSKRYGQDGRLRWPSTESIAKVLDATGESVLNFFAPAPEPMTSDRSGLPRGNFPPQMGSIPLLGLSQAVSPGFFEDGGVPTGKGWDIVEFPAPVSRRGGIFALEVQGQTMLPIYDDGTVLVVEPGTTLRRGDRLVVKSRAGELIGGTLRRLSSRGIDVMPFNHRAETRAFSPTEVEWTARILWASQ